MTEVELKTQVPDSQSSVLSTEVVGFLSLSWGLVRAAVRQIDTINKVQ